MFGPSQRGRRRWPWGSTPTLAHRSPLVLALIAMACDDPRPPGELRFAIGADTCLAYCLTAVRVTLYEEGDDLPLGPPLQATCGSDGALVFASLPAGLRVEVAVDAFDLSGDTLLSGRSEPVTIAASRQTELVVPLVATITPAITSAEPDPIAPSLTPTLTVLGDHLGPLGDYGLLLDETPLTATFTPATDDGKDQVTASLAGLSGASLTARRCGVASAPYPLRVTAPTPGAATVTGLPLCGGAAVGAAHIASGTSPKTVLAWRCEAAPPSQLVVMVDGAVCPLDPAGAWPLAAAPTGPIAVSNSAESAWVALPEAVARVNLATGVTTTYPVTATALAATDGTNTNTSTNAVAWAIADELVELHDDGTITPRPDLFPELDFVALAAATSTTSTSSRHLWVAATANGQGRLVAIADAATPSAYPIPCAPTQLAATDQDVVLACPDRLLVWDVASSTTTSLALTATALAIPPAVTTSAPDLAFATTSAGLVLVDLAPSPKTVVTWPPSEAADLLVALSGHRLLVLKDATLHVLTPFSPAGPCP